MKKITGTDIINLIKLSLNNDNLKQDLPKLTKSDFDGDDILVNFFFKVYPDGFNNTFANNTKNIEHFANTMERIKKDICSHGLRKAHNLLQNIRNASNSAVELENVVNESQNINDGFNQVKAAKLINFLSKYVNGCQNQQKLHHALKYIHSNDLKNASKNIHEVFDNFYPEKNVKLAFTTLKNQVGESYQLCPKGIYNYGYAIPMALSNCRDYCIDVRMQPDGTVGCNYLKWLNENLVTNEQAWHLFDRYPMEQENMNLEKGERSKFPISDQDPQDSKIIRKNNEAKESWEIQLTNSHAKYAPKQMPPKSVISDSAIESLLKDVRDAFDDNELDTLEEQLIESLK